jgi:hypothetical protein
MARAWRLLLAAAAAVADAAHEKYVIQAYDPAHIGAIDAKPPDGASTIELSAGEGASTKVSYSVARTGRRKGVAQKSFLDDDAAALALSSGEEPASPRHRAGVASMAWRSTRRFRTTAP